MNSNEEASFKNDYIDQKLNIEDLKAKGKPIPYESF
jgi:hypothetical protein